MQKLRMAMIGGGPGAFIGAVHRTAARMDGLIDIVAGAFSSSPDKSRQMGEELSLDPARVYPSWEALIDGEKALPERERIHFVSIVTPNHLHFQPAKAALEAGFHVAIDKPIAFNLEEALALQEVVERTGNKLLLTHTYAGYPMIREARERIAGGEIGLVRKVYVTYPQGWLYNNLESSDQKQAAWRTDPARSGLAGAMGDIGTHAFHLAEYVSGLRTSALCAQINTVVPGRRLDDDGAVLLQYDGGATGVLVASQVLSGEENALTIKVYGDKGGLEWRHTDPNSLWLRWPDAPAQLLRAGTPYLSDAAKANTRTPAGHPEGFLEAFANLYRNFAWDILGTNGDGQTQSHYPGVEDGVRGMQFVETVIQSGRSNEKWTRF